MPNTTRTETGFPRLTNPSFRPDDLSDILKSIQPVSASGLLTPQVDSCEPGNFRMDQQQTPAVAGRGNLTTVIGRLVEFQQQPIDRRLSVANPRANDPGRPNESQPVPA